jgi:predicted lipoprotein
MLRQRWLKLALSLLVPSVLLWSACQKDAAQENVRPIGSSNGGSGARSGGPSGNGGAGESGGGATSGESGTSGDGDGDGDGDNPGDGDGDGDNPGDGDGDGDNPGDGDGDGDGDNPGDGDGDTDPPWPTPPFTKRGLLETTGTCARLLYDAFLTEAEALKDTTATYESSRSEENLDAARAAWRKAHAAWQQAEAFLVGPAARPDEFMTGGQSMRDEIYSYPYGNPCSMDVALVNGSFSSGSFGALSISLRGLGAIEYLLFQAPNANACPSSNDINDEGGWAALGADAVATRRAEYAAKAASDVVARTRTLIAAWHPDEGDFYGVLASAGEGSAIFDTQQKALNAVTAALYYIEIEIKDRKLVKPLGLEAPCSNCSALLESNRARASADALRNNVIGIRKLFEGCGPAYSGLGFDDWLLEVQGDDELASAMIGALQTTQDAIDAAGTLEETLTSDPARVTAIYTGVKGFTDRLKTELITVLNLAPPPIAGGDTD